MGIRLLTLSARLLINRAASAVAPPPVRTSRAPSPEPPSSRPPLRWPLEAWSCAAVRASDIRPRILRGGAVRPRRRAEGVDPAQEALEQAVGLLRAFHLGHVAAAVQDDLLGAGQPLGDVALERGRDQRVVAAPDEQRRRRQLGQAGIETALAVGLVEVD